MVYTQEKKMKKKIYIFTIKTNLSWRYIFCFFIRLIILSWSVMINDDVSKEEFFTQPRIYFVKITYFNDIRVDLFHSV